MAIEFPPPTYDSAHSHASLRSELAALARYQDLIWFMVRRNLIVRYRRSSLGIVWTMLEPLFTMLVMTLIYGALFPRIIPGFPIFVLSGVVAWGFFSHGTQQALSDLLSSGSLISRVLMPKSIFPVVAVCTALVNFMIAFALLLLFMLVMRWPLTPALLFTPVTMLLGAAATLGTALAVAPLAVFFRDTANIYQIFLRLLMYLSGIFYTLEHLPGPLQQVIRWVPTYNLVAMFRQPIYAGTLPDPLTVIYMVGWAALMLAIGLWVFARYSDQFIHYV